MDAINFTWNEQKNEANQTKHGIAFEEAGTVFYDINARLIRDDEHSEDEERYIILDSVKSSGFSWLYTVTGKRKRSSALFRHEKHPGMNENNMRSS